jgi:DNA modification methylase
MVAPRALRPPGRVTRTHPKAQIEAIAKSMQNFGVMTPVITDEKGLIRAGVARWQASQLLGLKLIPAIRVMHLSETEFRAFQLADNKLSEMAGWDREALAIELEELQVALPEIGLDLSNTGFEPDEIDGVMLDFQEDPPAADEQALELTQGPAVSRLGDTWKLGGHRLRIDDARDPRAFEELMAGAIAAAGFLDPPYNVPMQGHAGGRGQTRHREFACARGDLNSVEFTGFLKTTLGHCARHSTNGAIHYVCMDWRHAKELLDAGLEVYGEYKNICVWVKTNAGQGSFYRSQHELVFVYKCGKGPHINTFPLGANGRSRSNVWRYAGVNTFKAGRMDELRQHPTVKPVEMVVDALRDCSRRGSIVLDAFCGSGTTILAAERIGRRAYCLEIGPLYADVAIRRWQRFTRRDAILESTGQTFSELEAERCAPQDQATPLGTPRRRRSAEGL